MADMNKATAGVMRRIANGEDHIIYHLDQELRWGGNKKPASKLTLEEKIQVVRRVHRVLKKRQKNESK